MEANAVLWNTSKPWLSGSRAGRASIWKRSSIDTNQSHRLPLPMTAPSPPAASRPSKETCRSGSPRSRCSSSWGWGSPRASAA